MAAAVAKKIVDNQLAPADDDPNAAGPVGTSRITDPRTTDPGAGGIVKPGTTTPQVLPPDLETERGGDPDITTEPRPDQIEGSGAVADAITNASGGPSAPNPTMTTPTSATAPATRSTPSTATTGAPAAGTPTTGTSTAGTGFPSPVLRDLDEAKDTVAGRLSKLMDVNNPIIAQARANAIKSANDRGMANSSMASGAAEEAAVASMLPVAQQDAQTSFTQGRANQDTSNQFSLTDATFGHQNEMQDKDIASNQKIAETGANAQVASAGIHAGATVSAAQIGAAASERMQQASIAAQKDAQVLDGQIRGGLLDKQVAANAGLNDANLAQQRTLSLQQAQVNTQANYTAQYTTILNNHDMSPEDKTQAIVHLNAIYAGSPFLPPNLVIPAYNPGGTPAPTGQTHTTNDGGGE